MIETTAATTCSDSEQVSFVPAWSPVALTARGTAYLRLAEFRDVWAGLSSADRAYFAAELTELLVDACLEVPVPTA